MTTPDLTIGDLLVDPDLLAADLEEAKALHLERLANIATALGLDGLAAAIDARIGRQD
jgi:hypothetical protein